LPPFTNLLKFKDLPKVLPWEEQHDAAFAAAKAELARAVPLAHPRLDAVLALATEASDTHISGVLQHQVSSHWQLLGFFAHVFGGGVVCIHRWRHTRQLTISSPR
jgi:hypothetical protein